MFHQAEASLSAPAGASPSNVTQRRQRSHPVAGGGANSRSLVGSESSRSKTTYHFKLVLLGDTAVGKSCLVVRFARNEFFEYQEPTIGAAFLTQSVGVSDSIVRFEIWDTAGAERYRSLAPMYYRGASAAVIVYDITSRESFEGAKAWVNELLSLNSSEVLIALAGNKCDLEQERAVELEAGRSYAESNNLLFFETSAKSGQNVFELFREIAERLPKRLRDSTPDVNNAGFQLNSRPRASSSSSGQSSTFRSCC